jgi:hypothetical protein
MIRPYRLLLAAVLPTATAACAGPILVESSPIAATVRYTSLDGIDEATRLAQKACAARGRSARLRNTAKFGLSDRYAHFDCV